MSKSNKTKKVPETEKVQSKQCLPLHGVFGVLSLFVVGSIAYSTYMVAMGTQGMVPKIMLIPQVTFATLLALYKFASK